MTTLAHRATVPLTISILLGLLLAPSVSRAGDARADIERPRTSSFRTTYSEEGIRLTSGNAGPEAWSISLSMTSYQGNDKTQPVSRGWLCDGITPVLLDRGLVEESYEDGPSGLRQRITLHAPPDDSGTVSIDFVLDGNLDLSMAGDCRSMDFEKYAGVATLRVKDLSVTDLDGRRLTSWLERDSTATDRILRIVFESADAEWPVTIESEISLPGTSGESARNKQQGS